MATNPPPYPPPGPPYGNDWKYQRRMMKEQARVQRDMLRAQAAAYRYRSRAMRHSSVVGPLILIAIGVIFLLVQTGRLESHQVWDWYGHWWPVVIIGAGVVMFLEWVFERYVHSDPAGYRSGLGGGAFSLLLLLVLAGVLFSGLRHSNGNFFGHGFGINQNDIDQFLGDKHESDQSIVQSFPAGARFSVDNPRGDVFVSGTSDDNQIHVAMHREIYSRSDSEADRKAQQLTPKIGTSENTVSMTVPPLPGGRADLTITVPPSAPITVTANHGDVHVSAIKAPVNVTANHGDVELSAITGLVSAHINNSDSSFSAHSITGALTIEGRGQDLTLSDLSGPVSINGDFFGTTHLEHIRGPIKFHSTRTDMQLGRLDGEADISNNSDLSASEVVGPLTLSTRSRNVTLDRISGDVSVTNSNGFVNVTNAPPLGNVTIENRNGDVSVTVPEHSSFSVSAETTNGDLNNDFSFPTEGTDSHKNFAGTVGKGGPTLHISTSQADVSLKKASVMPLPPTPPRPPKLSIVDGDGSSVIIGNDGVRINSDSDGSKVIIGKDGVHIKTGANGSSFYRAKDGTTLNTEVDGSKFYTSHDGTQYTENVDGSKIYAGKDGTRITIEADGSQTAQGPGGKPLSDQQVQSRLQQAKEAVRRIERERDAASRAASSNTKQK